MKKLIVTLVGICFILPATVKATEIQLPDPCGADVFGYWRLDEGAGATVADDSSKYDGPRTANGTPSDGQVIDPNCDQLDFSGGTGGKFDGYADFTMGAGQYSKGGCARLRLKAPGSWNPSPMITTKGTWAMWAKIAADSPKSIGANRFMVGFRGTTSSPNNNRIQLFCNARTNYVCVGLGQDNQLDGTRSGNKILATNTWYHIALTWNYTGSGGSVTPDGVYQVYVDGIDIPSGGMTTGMLPGHYRNMTTQMAATGDIGNTGGNGAGAGATNEEWYGLIDEVAFYNKALSREEICYLAGADPNKAWNPTPDDNEGDPILVGGGNRGHYTVALNAMLTWSAGKNTTSHDIYLGTSKTAVANADTSDTEYKTNRTTASWGPGDTGYPAGGLSTSKIYYWRIDENLSGSGTPNPAVGNVWKFVTLPVASTRLVPAEYPTIQTAIDASYNGDTVVVAPGTYTGNGNRDIDFEGKAITVRSENGPNTCIIDCQGSQAEPHRGFYFRSGEGSNSVLSGFTITNGWASSGGGIYNSSSSPTVTNCTFSRNSATSSGGGMYNYSSSLAVTNCTFSQNSANIGGGMYNNYRSGPTVTNCTFSGNSAANSGGGMYNYNSSNPNVTNCILWGNTGASGAQIYNNGTSLPVVQYCDIQGGWQGMGNIDANPLFVYPDNNDFHLLLYSPCIDAGDPNYIAGPNETDLDGNLRVVGNRIDMGAYEYQQIRLPDLEVTSEDITFSAYPGIRNQPVTIWATIRNIGTATANDVNVVFKDFNDIIGSQIISSIAAGESQIVSIERTWDQNSFRFITVEVDPNNVIPEIDDVNNNSASKVYQVGEKPPGPGVSIELSCSAPTGFPQGTNGSINGQALYKIQITGQQDLEGPVRGGTVSAQIIDCNGTQQSLSLPRPFTDGEGRFNVPFAVPCRAGNVFDVNITVTDGRFTESWRKTFNVTQWRDFSVGNITFSDNNPDVNEPITISATVYASSDNTNAEPNVPVTFYAYSPMGVRSQIGDTQYTGQMARGASKTVSVSWSGRVNGDYYIQAVLEPDFSDDISWNNQTGRNIHVGPIIFPMLTVTANPKYNVHKGEIVHITVNAREPLPSDRLDSITVKDSDNRDIPFLPSDPCHPTPTQWLYQTIPLPPDTATGTAVITVTGTDSNETSYTGYGYFEVTDIPVRFDISVRAEDINFSKNNPDINEPIIIDALICAASDNTRTEPNIPVTFYAEHLSTGERYKIGRTQYTGTIERGGNWSVSTTWRNAATGGYKIEASLEPGFSDDNYENNRATQAIVVGDYPFVAYFAEPNNIRIGRTQFKYTSKVTLYNNSDVGIEDVRLELMEGPTNMTNITDPCVTYPSIGGWGSATSGDTCKFVVDRAREITECEVVWRATYKMAGTSERLEQVFSNCGSLPGIPGDITGDGKVDYQDLAILAAQWLQPPGTPSADIAPPPNGDEIVDFKDFAELANHWLE